MANDYGVYKENEAGVIEWVTDLTPLTMGVPADAIKWNEQGAINTASYLNGLGNGTYFIGHVPRPHA